MGRWHRKAKRINLKPLVRDSDCTIVLSTAFPEAMLQEVRSACHGSIAASRIVSEGSAPSPPDSILIFSAPGNADVERALIAAGWRGLVYVCPEHGRKSILDFLARRSRYVLAERSWRTDAAADLPQFVIDLESVPARIRFPTL